MRMRAVMGGLAMLAGLSGMDLHAQERRVVVVVSFDQQAIQGNLREVFEQDGVNVGLSIARLIARQLGDRFAIVEATPGNIPADADAVLTGSVLVFGSGSATAGVSGPRVGGVRVGIGRRTTTAAVALEARLTDVASGELLGVFPAQATDSRSGVGLFARVPDLIDADGVIDMTRQDFAESLLGTVTTRAVGDIVLAVGDAGRRIGTVAVAPPAAPVSAPSGGAAPVGGGWTGGAFSWAMWRFQGNEQFRFAIVQTEGGERTDGTYELGFQPAGEGRIRMRVSGRLGDQEFSSSTTTRFEDQNPNIGFQELAAMGPAGMLLFNPGAWWMMWGRELSLGDEWSQSQGGESFSVRVERECSYGGQGGLLILTRVNGRETMAACVSPDVPLPLMTMLADEDNRYEIALVSFSRN